MREADMRRLLPRVAAAGLPTLFVVGASDLKTHERLFLKLLGPKARHLVIKDGLHTWPYQPKCLGQYRAAALAFAAEAFGAAGGGEAAAAGVGGGGEAAAGGQAAGAAGGAERVAVIGHVGD